jgi:putative nucleotidyltransferase with HDIG domain
MALRSENFLLRRYIEKAMVDLPAIPGIVIQVIQAADRDEVTTAEIEALISKDAAIATKILKVVNSAYFGLPRQVSTVGQAVVILGLHQVRNLAMSLGVLSALSSTNPRIMEYQKGFWSQSFASAACAQEVARMRGLPKKDQDAIFVGGLLHDIGRLFLITLFNLPYQQVIREAATTDLPLRLVEERVLGASHAELGAALAERWNFPEELVVMIRNHDGDFTQGQPYSEYCVHIADVLAAEIDDSELAVKPLPVSSDAAAWARLSDDDVERIKANIQIDVEKARELLGIL